MSEFQKFSRAYLDNFDTVFSSVGASPAAPAPAALPEPPAHAATAARVVEASGMPASPYAVFCPLCQAPPEKPCRDRAGLEMGMSHKSRLVSARFRSVL